MKVTSKGIAGVHGVSFVVLLATLGGVGIRWKSWRLSRRCRPAILDMARTALNVVGNALAAVLVIAKWGTKFDRKKRWPRARRAGAER